MALTAVLLLWILAFNPLQFLPELPVDLRPIVLNYRSLISYESFDLVINLEDAETAGIVRSVRT